MGRGKLLMKCPFCDGERTIVTTAGKFKVYTRCSYCKGRGSVCILKYLSDRLRVWKEAR